MSWLNSINRYAMGNVFPYGMPYHPESLSGVYGVNLHFSRKDTERQRLQFEAKVVYCGQYMGDYSIFHLSRECFVVNKNHSGEHLYALAAECGKGIYPVTILTNKNGEIILIRTGDLPGRWTETRAKLDRYYKGEVARQYLDNVEAMLNDPEKAKRLVTADLFFSIFFRLIYRRANTFTEVEFQNELCLFPFSLPLQFECVQSIDNVSLNNRPAKGFHVMHKGATRGNYTLGDFAPQSGSYPALSKNPVSSDYMIKYEVDKASMAIESIEGNFFIRDANDVFSDVKMSAYRLEERVVEQETDMDFNDAEKQQRKRDNSFLNRIKKLFKE